MKTEASFGVVLTESSLERCACLTACESLHSNLNLNMKDYKVEPN